MVVRSHISKRCDPERRGAIQSTQGSAHGHSGLICETDSVLLTAQVGWKDFSSKHPQDNSCTTGRVYLFSLEGIEQGVSRVFLRPHGNQPAGVREGSRE